MALVYWLILAALALWVFLLANQARSYAGIDGEDAFWASVVCFFPAALLVFFVPMLAGNIAGTHAEHTDTRPIVAQSDEVFLVSGEFDDGIGYMWYVHRSDGSLHRVAQPSENVRIIETDGEPYVETYTEYLPDWAYGDDTEWNRKYKVYVPNENMIPVNTNEDLDGDD